MSKKRGLSLEEKRKRMLEIFYEKKEFFHLKDLEKIAPKEKGITPMSVKDVLQSLVDDDLVICDKVGSSSYYWSFPSQALNTRQQKLNKAKDELSILKKKLETVEKKLDEAKSDRTPSEERTALLKEHSALKCKKETLLNNIDQQKENDPEVINALISDTNQLKNDANRWTDNLFTLKSWIKRKFPIDENTLNKQFSIPEELDYIE